VFGDFNEILNSDEKLGWLERDARQMEGFRECLSTCGLIDLGLWVRDLPGVMGELGINEPLLGWIEW